MNINIQNIKKGVKALPHYPVYLRHYAYEKGVLKGSRNYQRFIILSRKRSGTNFLRYMLDGHPAIETFGELFMSNSFIPWTKRGFEFYKHSDRYVRQLRDNPVSFLHSAVFKNYPEEIKAVGFKIFPTHALDPETKPIWKHLKEDKELKVIYLIRENYLANLVSKKQAIETQQWISHKGPTKAAPVHFDAQYLEEKLQEHENVENYYRHYFRNSQMLELTYEELVANKRKWEKNILHFLGVPYRNLTPETSKQSKSTLSERIENYSELKTYFSGTKWERFFQDADADA